MKVLNVSDIAASDTSLPLRKGETYVDRDLIDGILKQHWDKKTAWIRDGNEEGQHFTYGEATELGVRQLIHSLELEGLSEDLSGQPIRFYDLGSGAGKLVVQMFLENVVTVAVGVELSKHRHSIAESHWQALRLSSNDSDQRSVFRRLQNDQYMGKPRVQFLNQDILDTDFSDATHLYVSSLCFSDEVVERLSEMIIQNHRQCGKLQVVVALSDLPILENDDNGPDWKKSFELIHMTWGFSCARVYRCVG